MDLPEEFKSPDEMGIKGGVEYGFMSTSEQINVIAASSPLIPTSTLCNFSFT